MALGVVRRDGVREGLHDHRLAGLGGSDDEAALALADGSDEVDDPRRDDALLGLEPQAVLRVERRQLAELRAAAGLVGRHAVDRVELGQRRVLLAVAAPADALLLLLLALAGRLDRAGDRVALAQVVALDHLQRHVDVAAARQVAGGAHERVVVEDVEDAGHGHEDVVLGDLRLGLLDLVDAGRSGGAALVAVAPAVAATAAAAALVVVSGGAVLGLLPLAGGRLALPLAGSAGARCAPGARPGRGCPRRGRAGRRARARRPGHAGRPGRGCRRAARTGRREVRGRGRGAPRGRGARRRRSARALRAVGALGPVLADGRVGLAALARLAARLTGTGRAALAVLARLDGGDEVALAHLGGAADAHARGEALELGEPHGGQRSGAPRAGARGRLECGGVCHEGSFPSLVDGLDTADHREPRRAGSRMVVELALVVEGDSLQASGLARHRLRSRAQSITAGTRARRNDAPWSPDLATPVSRLPRRAAARRGPGCRGSAPATPARRAPARRRRGRAS